MLKKLFAAIVAATMVLGLASFASAATPSFPDTVGIPEETQIATLKALGIVTGDEQGRFNPDGTFTRAQMAVIAVKLMGQAEAAEFMKQPTVFPDVEARHQWAWGYINVAVGQGIITGRPDGTFGPDDPATYVDVLVLLLRILNYEPILVGTWPTKYLVKANEIGLTKGVSFRADVPATRRNVAVLAYNALTARKVIQVAYGAQSKYVVSGDEGTEVKTLLDNLGTTPDEGWLVSSPEIFGADKDKIVVWVDSEKEGTKGVIDDGEEKVIPLAEGTDVTGLLGHRVKVWKNTDGEAFLVQDKTPASAIKAAYYYNGKVYLAANDKEVDLSSVYCFRNYEGPDLAKDVPALAPKSGDEITIVYDGTTPRFAFSLGYTTAVVDSVSTIYQRIAFADGAGTLTVKDWDVKFVGAVEELGEIQKNDVVQYIANPTAKRAVLIVTRNAPTGKFTRIEGTTITVGGVNYKRAPGGSTPDQAWLGSDVKVLLNKSGRYVKVIKLGAPTVPSTIAVVLDQVANVPTPEGLVEYWKLLLADGTKTALPIEDALHGKAAEGDIIEYKVTDGRISWAEVKMGQDPGDPGLILVPSYKLLDGKLITSTTAIFYFESGKEPQAIGWDVLKDMSGIQGWILADGSKAKVVKITSATTAVAGDKLYGYVLTMYRYWDADRQTSEYAVSVLKDGTVVDYVYDSGGPFEGGEVVAFQMKAGKAVFTKLDEDQPAEEGYEWRVESIDDNLITLQKYEADGDKVANATKTYVIITDPDAKVRTQFVDTTGDEPVGLTGLSTGLRVRVYSDGDLSGTPVAHVIVVY
ncbi:MAG: S-layer homology domain-containing protein [Firmicutes bacterium]|nr:S-layer homology domain-containing protein [Candidatus Fermentithermobacillaceae bacterium]